MISIDRYACLAAVAFMALAAQPARASPSHPTAEDGEIWAIYPDGRARMLSYGTPETDNVAITLRCGRGGAVRVALPVQTLPSPEPATGAHWAIRVSLRSGAVRQQFAAQATMGGEGAEVRDLTIPLNNPVIRAFRTSFVIGTASDQWPARNAAERAVITRFFAGCAAH